jgi:hypothetical protein
MKKYVKPSLRSLGLLRLVTQFSNNFGHDHDHGRDHWFGY